MPMIIRVTPDMFEFSDVCSYMCNPVNLLGVPGAGLALEFRKRTPSYVDKYRAACRDNSLRIGTVQVIDETEENWGIINIPTKRHYADTTDRDDLARSLEALRDLLRTDRYRHATIGLPMLGCGLGKADYDVVYPMMKDYFDDLEATVFLSMSPERTEMRPRYLVIVGPPSFGLSEDDKIKIEEIVDKCMLGWGTTLGEYEGIVSGGYAGVDQFIAGETFGKDYENTFAYQRTAKRPLVVKADSVRNGVGSNLIQNNLLCEIADDIILFKPVGHNNNRLSGMQMWLEGDRMFQSTLQSPRHPRRIAVFGEKEPKTVNEQLIIPVQSDEN